MTLTAVMTSSRLEVVNGEKLGNSPEEDLIREYPLSISMTLQNTVIIEFYIIFFVNKKSFIDYTSLLI